MWMFVHLIHLVLSSATLSNEIFCGWFWSKTCYFYVPTTFANWILFLNHRNRKNVGGKHNILVHCVNIYAPVLAGVVLWNPFKWDILWYILIKNLVIFVPTTLVERILFPNHMNKKIVGGKYNFLVHYADASALIPFVVVPCNTFKWDILLCVHIHFKSLKCVLCVSLHCEIPVGLQD